MLTFKSVNNDLLVASGTLSRAEFWTPVKWNLYIMTNVMITCLLIQGHTKHCSKTFQTLILERTHNTEVLYVQGHLLELSKVRTETA